MKYEQRNTSQWTITDVEKSPLLSHFLHILYYAHECAVFRVQCIDAILQISTSTHTTCANRHSTGTIPFTFDHTTSLYVHCSGRRILESYCKLRMLAEKIGPRKPSDTRGIYGLTKQRKYCNVPKEVHWQTFLAKLLSAAFIKKVRRSFA